MALEADRLVTRGISVRVRRAGSGTSLIFLHGIRGWPEPMPFFDRLAQHYSLLIPEHPCFGASDEPPWLRSMPDLAMYYLDFLDHAFSSPVHVLGHSLGGWLAAEAAVRNTHRFASLTLLAPAGIRIKGMPTTDIFMLSPQETARHRFYEQSFAEASLKAAPANEEEIDIELQNKLAGVKFAWEPRAFDPDLEKWLHRITVPTHIVWGVEDKILPSAYARLWADRISGARVSLIEACGHLPQVEKPDLAADKILAFLDGVRA